MDDHEHDNESELDEIQLELENLNNATDEINKLEIELEEANSTFRILLNESTRRLKEKSKKIGSAIEKSRPFYDALEKAKVAQLECQRSAAEYRRANEIHSAAKETVALAEERFMSNSHEWQFDLAWQEMINHHIEKVMEAEKQKAESEIEHQRKTLKFHEAESKVQQLEQKLKSNIHKSRPYFEEKQICQDQLETQKGRIQQLQQMLQKAKSNYATSLKNLEFISESIHKRRGDYPPPSEVRGTPVGAESNSEEPSKTSINAKPFNKTPLTATVSTTSSTTNILNDFNNVLDNCELRSFDSHSLAASESGEPSSINSEQNHQSDNNKVDQIDQDVDELRLKIKSLAVRPIESADGKQEEQAVWENELIATVDKLDHLMLMKECSTRQYLQNQHHQQQSLQTNSSLPESPVVKIQTLNNSTLPKQKLKKIDPLPLSNVSLHLIPAAGTSQRFADIVLPTSSSSCDNLSMDNKKRKLSLQ